MNVCGPGSRFLSIAYIQIESKSRKWRIHLSESDELVQEYERGDEHTAMTNYEKQRVETAPLQDGKTASYSRHRDLLPVHTAERSGMILSSNLSM